MELESAINKLPEILRKSMDDNLCTCNEVKKRDIVQAIADGADSIETVCAKTYATDGNACCKRQVSRLIECIHDN